MLGFIVDHAEEYNLPFWTPRTTDSKISGIN